MNPNNQLKAYTCAQKTWFSPRHFVFIYAEFIWHYTTEFREVLLHSSHLDFNFLSLYSFISTKNLYPLIIHSLSQINSEYVEYDWPQDRFLWDPIDGVSSLVKPNNLFFISYLSVSHLLCESSSYIPWQPGFFKSEECFVGTRWVVTREVTHHGLLQVMPVYLCYDSSLLFSSVLCLVMFTPFWFSSWSLHLYPMQTVDLMFSSSLDAAWHLPTWHCSCQVSVLWSWDRFQPVTLPSFIPLKFH